jgi:hypothetical protein
LANAEGTFKRSSEAGSEEEDVEGIVIEKKGLDSRN